MIGIRLLAPTVAALVLVPALGQGGPDPALAILSRRLVVERAAAADAALAALERAIAPAVEAARQGTAMIVSGAGAPGPQLRIAATDLAAAEVAAADADAAVDALEGARRAADIGSSIEMAAPPGEVASIAAQLDGAAPVADAFADMRGRAESLVASLERSLVALEEGSFDEARDLVARARADHDALAAWEVELVTLPVWIETTDAMIGAVETIIEATEAGDEAAALEAASAFAGLAEEAAPADRALRIAIGEGGSAVTAAPMSRLADLLRAVAETRLEVASILRTVGG